MIRYLPPLLVLSLAALSIHHFPPVRVSAATYDKLLRNKVVLVCGASSGVGELLVYELASKGAKLLLVARTQAKLRQVRENALKYGSPQVEILSYDFADASNSSIVVEETIAVFGQLDYLILNHATMFTGMLLQHHQPEFIERVFRINVFSYMQVTVRALPYLERTKGHIFVTSSIAGEAPGHSPALFTSTKHALNGFYYSVQQELVAARSAVTLTVGALGLILTDRIKELLSESLNSYPTWGLGDVRVCATGMMESLIFRPRTFTYPKLFNNIYRALWYFLPHFHEVRLNKERNYDTVVIVNRDSLETKSDEMGFQKDEF